MKREIFQSLSPYDSEWKSRFEIEKELLKHMFGDAALEIEHIGSTSIEGLPSKPIVDMVVMINDHADADRFTDPLSKMGYAFHSKSSERHFYQKRGTVAYNLSIAYADRGGFWSRQILFRDYLRSHAEARDEYAELKKNLIVKFPAGIGEYSEGKTECVQKILVLAGWKEGQTYRDWKSGT